MAFSIDHRGPARNTFYFCVRRQSDGAYWSVGAGAWIEEQQWAKLPEQGRGYYSYWLLATTGGESYHVRVLPGYVGANTVKDYTCDSKGKPFKVKLKGKLVNATIVGGILHVDGKAEKPGVVLETRSSNGIAKYAAVKWAPSGICTCNCPGWSTNVKHRGKPLNERSCKHTKQVATMSTSSYLPSDTLPSTPPTIPIVGNVERSGRGVELD
jgi:hypothetical protein